LGTILLIEDHPLVRAGCRRVLQAAGAAILEAGTAADGLRLSREQAPELVVLDINLPDGDGFASLAALLADRPGLPVIILSMYEDAAMAETLIRRGAKAYVTKRDSPESLLQAVSRVAAGGQYVSGLLARESAVDEALESRLSELSARDRRIVDGLGEGKVLAEIAFELGQSYKTIANVTNMIRRRLGLRSNAALARLAVERRVARSPAGARASERE